MGLRIRTLAVSPQRASASRPIHRIHQHVRSRSTSGQLDPIQADPIISHDPAQTETMALLTSSFMSNPQPAYSPAESLTNAFLLDHPVDVPPEPQFNIHSFMPSFLGRQAPPLDQTLPMGWEDIDLYWLAKDFTSPVSEASETSTRDNLYAIRCQRRLTEDYGFISRIRGISVSKCTLLYSTRDSARPIPRPDLMKR